MRLLTKLSRWLKGPQKPRRKVSRFRPSIEALENRDCPAIYTWTYPGGVPSQEESFLNLNAWRVGGVVPTEKPGVNDDLVLGAAGAAMACRIGAEDLTVQNIQMEAGYLSTLHVRWGWTLTIKDGTTSVLAGGNIEIGGKYVEEGPDNHLRGNLVFDNVQVSWTGTHIFSTIGTEVHNWNQEGNIVVGGGSSLKFSGPVRNTQAEWLIEGANGQGTPSEFVVLPGTTGGLLFGQESIFNISEGAQVRWENTTSSFMHGAFLVPEGNTHYLVNYGKMIRVANPEGATPGGEVLVQFPVFLAGNNAELLLKWGDMKIDPTRTEVYSVECSPGFIGLSPGTVLIAPDHVNVLGGQIGLIPKYADESTSTEALVDGDVYVTTGFILLDTENTAEFGSRLSAVNWILSSTVIDMRFVEYVGFYHYNSLYAINSIYLDEYCYFNVTTFLGEEGSIEDDEEFTVMQTLTGSINGEPDLEAEIWANADDSLHDWEAITAEKTYKIKSTLVV